MQPCYQAKQRCLGVENSVGEGVSMGKKKKAKKPPASPVTQLLPTTIPPVPLVALLIDGENLDAPQLIPRILAEASKMGRVTIRQIFGNWSSPHLQAWKKLLVRHQLQPMGEHLALSGPNATDITLVIEAMDLYYRGVRHFCLVAGDSDYVPLVRRLRQGNCEVWVLGNASASVALKNEATHFFLLEDPASASPPTNPPAAGETIPAPSTPPLIDMLAAAYREARQHSLTEWVLLAHLGSAVRQQFPTFEERYGRKQLITLLKQNAIVFETRKRKLGNGEVHEVRLRPSPQRIKFIEIDLP